jgi:hypothetical protein
MKRDYFSKDDSPSNSRANEGIKVMAMDEEINDEVIKIYENRMA